MLNLLKSGEVIRQVYPGAKLDLDGVSVSPAEAGWSHGNYQLVEAPSPELQSPVPPTVDDFRFAIQSMLDQTAQTRRYDGGTTISTYVNSTNPAWAAEAQAFVTWRDAVWAYAYDELDKVEGGLRPIPAVEDFLAELPEIVWPG